MLSWPSVPVIEFFFVVHCLSLASKCDASFESFESFLCREILLRQLLLLLWLFCVLRVLPPPPADANNSIAPSHSTDVQANDLAPLQYRQRFDSALFTENRDFHSTDSAYSVLAPVFDTL